MTTRYPSLPTVSALAFALVVAPAFLACAQNAMDTSSNAAPSAPTASVTTPPVAAPADTNAPAATERPTTYTIVSGDSLWTIAHQFGTTVVKLRNANNLKKGALLHPGQVLKIPPAPSDKTTK